MTKIAKSVETKLQSLIEYRFGKEAKQDETVLISALSDKHYRVVAKAAELAGERLCYGAMSALKESYRRLLNDAVKKDPQCIAKQAIVRSLVTLDCPDAQFFTDGIRYRQMEPWWGAPTDSAVDVRVSCAMGLVNTGYPRALHELTALLNDAEVHARSGAVRAIVCGNPSEAELLLRFKILIGDKDTEVVGECFTGLLEVASIDALPMVANYLSHADDALREYAAIALGESQLPEAFTCLRQASEAAFVSPEQKRILTRAAALHRSDAAFEWLLALIAEGSSGAAEAALTALSIYKENRQLAARIKAALVARGDSKLDQQFATQWTSGGISESY